jgi:hypothetical protein
VVAEVPLWVDFNVEGVGEGVAELAAHRAEVEADPVRVVASEGDLCTPHVMPLLLPYSYDLAVIAALLRSLRAPVRAYKGDVSVDVEDEALVLVSYAFGAEIDEVAGVLVDNLVDEDDGFESTAFHLPEELLSPPSDRLLLVHLAHLSE